MLTEPVVVLDKRGDIIAELDPAIQNGPAKNGTSISEAQSLPASKFELEDHPIDVTPNISVSSQA